MQNNLNLKIYRIKMGSLGEYVFCATSMMHLYELMKKDKNMPYEILWDYRNNKLFTFKKFKIHFEKWITESPLHLGFLGGYSE
jgi:hypothetical protein